MKKIQPFTIGTKLSVPNGSKCQDCVDILLPAPALDESRLKSSVNDRTCDHDQPQHIKPDPPPLQDCPEEEQDSPCPPASSRSIRKIAICGSAETETEGGGGDKGGGGDRDRDGDSSTTTYEPDKQQSSTEKPHVDKTLQHSELWRKRKMKSLEYDFGVPAFPLEHPEDASPSQQRDIKDFQNALIQLTTSLDLQEDDPVGTVLKKPSTAGLSLETFGRKHSIGEHIDKLRLKFRSLLQDYQQDLMLALDVSSFYQQADVIISTINSKVSSLQAGVKEKENRETAEQIKMLSESAARLSNLHPTLASRVTRKQAEVKESWELLQDALRNHRADTPSKPLPSLSRAHSDPQTVSTESQHFPEPELHGGMGKDVKEEQNRLRGSECCQDPWVYRMLSPIEECSSRSRASLSEGSCCKLDNSTEKHNMDSDSKDQPALSETQQKPLKLDSTTSADQTWSWLKDSISLPSAEIGNNSKQSHELKSSKIEELLDQVDVLWEGLRKRFGHEAEVDQAEKQLLMDDEAAQETLEDHHPLEDVEEYHSGMLAKFLQFLDHKDIPALQNGSGVSEALMDDLNVRRGSHNHDQNNEDLLAMQLSTLTLRINQHLSRCAELSMDILDMETDMAMLCDPEVAGLEGIQEQQEDLEVDCGLIEGEVENMEILVRQVPPAEQSDLLMEEVQSVLQAWEEVGRNMAENRERLAKFKQLQNFFENYLATIAWTESTRSYILTGNTALQSEAEEIDCGIEQKLQEFDQLAADGQRLTEEGNYLAEIIKERTDELKSMLDWIQVNWKTQREQLSLKKNKSESNEESQHSQNQALDGVESPLDQQSSRPDDPALVIQEPCSAQTSLGSSICLILSFDEQSSGIGHLSSSSSEGHMQQLIGYNTKQWQQPSLDNHKAGQQSQEEDQEQSLPVLGQSTEQKAHFSSSMQVQHLQGNHQTKTEQSIMNMQPVDSMFQETEVFNQLDNIQKQQQSPVNDEEQWQQSPKIIQVQGLKLPGVHQASANKKEEQKEQKERAETLIRTCLHHQQSPPTPVSHQHSSNSYSSEQQLILSDQIHSSSPQKNAPDQLQNQLFITNHSSSEQRSAQFSLPAPHSAQVKDQQSEILNQRSPSNQQTLISSEQVEAAEVTHRVSTYLHVTDSLKADRPSQMSSSYTSALEQRLKRKESNQRRNSTLGLVRHDVTQSNASSCRLRTRSNTWPTGGQDQEKHQPNTELQVFVKKCLVDVLSTRESHHGDALRDSNTTSMVPKEPIKNICSYLSLGSTLSFSLPRVFYNNLESSEETSVVSELNKQPILQASPEGSDSALALVEVNPNTDHDSQATLNYELNMVKLDLNDENEDLQHCKAHEQNTKTPTIESSHSQVETHQDISDEQRSESEDSMTLHTSCSLTCSPASSCRHKCLSVHTKIKDLNGHLYHASRCTQWSCHTNSALLENEDLPKSKLGSSKSKRVVFCGVRDCTVCGSALQNTPPNTEDHVEVPQPSHWQFQQEEKELEDIWRGRVDDGETDWPAGRGIVQKTGMSLQITKAK